MGEGDRIILAKFRAMMKESGNQLLNSIEIEDDLLLRVVRRPKVDLKESLQTLKNFMKVRFSYPYADVIEKTYPSALHHVFDKHIFGVLKYRDQLGRAVVWCKLSRWDPWQIFKRDLCRAALLIGWEVLGSEVTQLKGVVGILDLSGCSLAHISKLASPLKMQKMMNLFKLCNPVHLGGVHVVGAPVALNVILTVAKPFAPVKYRNMIHHHPENARSLRKYVPAKILPGFLGGCLTENDATDKSVVDRLRHKDDYYKELIQVGKKVSSTPIETGKTTNET